MFNPITVVQTALRDAGFDPGPLDGEWGLRTAKALNDALTVAQAAGHADAAISRPLAWGARVSTAFRFKVLALCDRLGLDPDYLMACMAWESGESFSPTKRNGAGSGAIGLIQFMPSTAIQLGTSVELLEKMTALEQLDVVERYFQPYQGRLRTLSDHYMAILWPKAIGKPESEVLWAKGTSPTTYRQNAGLDVNADGLITKAEAAGKVRQKLDKGLLLGNVYRVQT